MTNTKTTKRALLSSIMALILCFSMLLGTTFAWFTDSVTSVGNIIQAGTLNVEMYYADGTKAVPTDASGWETVQGKTLYTEEQRWEPGYTDAKHIKISNEGTLDLKYQLAIVPTGEVSELADVIDVYLYEIADTDANATQVATRADLDTDMYVGTLAEVIRKGIVQGNLAADTDYTTTIVLKMQESANNDYQGKSIGDDFTIQLLATQLTSENDSFDNQYDADAWVSGMAVYNAADLQAAINAGENVKLMNDIELTEQIVIPAPATTTFAMRSVDETVIDLNGKNITIEGATAIRNEGNLRIIGKGKITSVSGYAIRVQRGSLVIDSNDIEVSSDFGAISVFNGADVTINGGDYFNKGYNDKTSHTIYLGGYGTININGGTFDSGYSNGGIDTICGYGWSNDADEKAIININGGTFYPSELDGSYYFISNYDGSWTAININGGVFHKYDPSKINGTKFATGMKSVNNNGVYYVVPDGVDNIITSTDALVALGGTKINGTYMLMADLDMSGKTMKSMEVSGGATVTFIGNGHTISDLTLNAAGIHGMTGAGNEVAGLFDLSAPATTVSLTVNDLILENAVVTCNGYAGVVVGYNSNGSSSIALNNVDVKGATVTAETVAALVGYTTGNVNLTDCDVSGLSLTGEAGRPEKVGAFVGTANTSTCTVTVINCTNDTGYNYAGRVINGAKMTIDGASVVTNAGELGNIITGGATNITLAEDMTIVADNLKDASNELTVNLADNTTVTVASGAATSKDLIFTGDKSSKVVLVNTNPGYEGKLSYQDNANLTFKGITFDANEISGICARGGEVTFIDCHITGELEQTIASKFVFSGCTFDVGVTQVGYGCSDVVFENCTFETDGYGIKIYKEANEKTVNLTVKGCSFKNTGSDARSAILLDHILDGFNYNITVENCTFEGYTTTPTATYNKWAARMIVTDSFVKTADGQHIFSYQTGAEGGAYHKLLTTDQLVVTVK